MPIATVRVTGFYTQSDGVTPAEGNVTFIPQAVRQGPTLRQIVVPVPLTAALTTGRIDVRLPASDDLQLTPTGIYYQVVESILDSESRPPYAILFSSNDTELDLAEIAPVTRPDVPPAYLLHRLATLTDVDTAGRTEGSVPSWSQAAGKFVMHIVSGGEGSEGPPGASAYEIAVQQGFVGTITEWLVSLVGPRGEPGEPGTTTWSGLSDIPAKLAAHEAIATIADLANYLPAAEGTVIQLSPPGTPDLQPWLVLLRPNDGTDSRAWPNGLETRYFDAATGTYRLTFYLNDKLLPPCVRGNTGRHAAARQSPSQP